MHSSSCQAILELLFKVSLSCLWCSETSVENPFLSSLTTAGVSSGAGKAGQAALAVKLFLAYNASLPGGISEEAKMHGNIFKCFSLQ